MFIQQFINAMLIFVGGSCVQFVLIARALQMKCKW